MVAFSVGRVMRFSLSPKFGKSAGNLLVVGLLASAATGCSSDVTRFGGLFSSSGQDQITTSSIPRSGGQQGDPVPRADLGGSAVASQSGYGGGKAVKHDPPVLFHVEHDPSEKHDVAKANPDIIAAIRREAEAHQATVEPVANQLELKAQR